MNDLPELRVPNPLDLHVGARIRVRRRTHGVSQGKLADAIGLTFQQLQKYEHGANRVSASKLYQIATALRSPISYFFEGLPDPAGGSGDDGAASDEQSVHTFLMTEEGLELARLFPSLPGGRVRRRFLDLIGALTAGGDVKDEDNEG